MKNRPCMAHRILALAIGDGTSSRCGHISAVLAMLLCLAMLLSVFPVAAAAEDITTDMAAGDAAAGDGDANDGIVTMAAGAANNLVQNGSFESPRVSGAFGNIVQSNSDLKWKTTSSTGVVEIGTSVRTYVASLLGSAVNTKKAAGNQFAEIAGNSPGSLYQTVDTVAGENYEWGLFHRARSHQDVMMLTLGPEQAALSANAAGADQLQQLAEWMRSEVESEMAAKENSRGNFAIKRTVYSAEFAEKGSFAGNPENPFSLIGDDAHPVELTLWFVGSNGQGWFAFGTNSLNYVRPENLSDADGSQTRDCIYSAKTDKSMLAFTNFYSEFTGVGGADGTFGNMIDGVYLSKAGERDIAADFSTTFPVGDATRYAFCTSNVLRLDGNVANGGFEEGPDLPANNRGFTLDMPSWRTTATDHCKEVMGAVYNVYYPRQWFYPAEGDRAVELDAHQPATLYQYIDTLPGKRYEWGLQHRGRQGIDTMALIIGPRQKYEPYKDSKSTPDQYQKIVTWLQNNIDADAGLDIVNYDETGCSKKIILYSTPFNMNGGFEYAIEQEDAFSWTSDETHTEEWCVWIMSSDKDKWYAYGSSAVSDGSVPDYDFTYNIPEGQEESVFAFVSFHSATGKADSSVGNFLDGISFKELYHVEAYTTPNGTGTYRYDGDDPNTFTYLSNYTGYAEKGFTFSIDATPAPGRKFLGAIVNGQFVDASSPLWAKKENEDGTVTYVYNSEPVEKHYIVRLIFSAQHVLYDVNGGDLYHYDGTDDTGYEVPLSVTNTTYTSHAATKADNDGWMFVGWQYTDSSSNASLYDAVHTIDYVVSDSTTGDGSLGITGHTVNEKDGSISQDTSKIAGIPGNEGVTMVAQWRYRQAFVPMTMIDGEWKNSAQGGTVSTSLATQIEGERYVQEGYETSGVAYFAPDSTFVQAVAMPNSADDYRFEGWYDADGKLVSSSLVYMYTMSGRSVNTVYARFSKKSYSLAISKTVTGNMGDKQAYFEMTLELKGVKRLSGDELALQIEGLDPGTFDLVDGETGFVNPTSLTIYDNGEATVTFALRSGQTALIRGIPANAEYTVQETDYTKLGYKATYSPAASGKLDGAQSTRTVEVVVRNQKQVVVPSGISSDETPWMVLMACGLAGAVGTGAIAHQRKSRRGED